MRIMDLLLTYNYTPSFPLPASVFTFPLIMTEKEWLDWAYKIVLLIPCCCFINYQAAHILLVKWTKLCLTDT